MKGRYFCLGLVLALMTCCSARAQKVTVDYDRNVTFAGYKTYTWTAGTPVKNSLMDQRILEGIDKQLASKGLQKVEAASSPDLIVLYHAAVGTEVQLNTTNMGGWGWRWGGGVSTTEVDRIPVGQLAVDIGDSKTKRLVWLGNASGTLSDDPGKNEEKMNKALEKMFKKFPPPAPKK